MLVLINGRYAVQEDAAEIQQLPAPSAELKARARRCKMPCVRIASMLKTADALRLVESRVVRFWGTYSLKVMLASRGLWTEV